MHWTDTPIHFVDFEGNLTSGIVEYGVVILQRGEIVETATRFCRSICRIREMDTAVHGLAESDVAAAAPFSDDFARFADWRERGPLAAHFAQAENTLIKAVWPYPRRSPNFARPGEAIAEWGPWLDTGRLYAELFANLPSAQLERLVDAVGVRARLDACAERWCAPSRRRFHAALYDALAGALLLLHLVERVETATIPWLLQMSTANPEKRSALQQGELF